MNLASAEPGGRQRPTASRPDLAIFIRELEGGGAQRDAILLANALHARGLRLSLLTLRPDGALAPLVDRAIPIVPVAARSLRAALPALRRAIAAAAPRVLMSSEAAQNVVTAAAVATLPRGVRPKLILREVTSPTPARTLDPYRQNRMAYGVVRHAFRQADCVLTLTEGARQDLIANFHVPAPLISVMRSNAVIDPATAARLAAWDGESGRENDLIVLIGRLSAEKNQMLALQAMALLPDGCRARLAIVGEGPERAALEGRIAALHLQDRVQLTGHSTDPFGWQMRAAVGLSTSHFEGLGNVLIEALACGTPVVAADCPYGPREILDNGRWGRLTPPGDAAALARAIAMTLAEKPDRAALRQAAQRYSSSAAAEDFLSILTARGLVGPALA